MTNETSARSSNSCAECSRLRRELWLLKNTAKQYSGELAEEVARLCVRALLGTSDETTDQLKGGDPVSLRDQLPFGIAMDGWIIKSLPNPSTMYVIAHPNGGELCIDRAGIIPRAAQLKAKEDCPVGPTIPETGERQFTGAGYVLDSIRALATADTLIDKPTATERIKLIADLCATILSPALKANPPPPTPWPGANPNKSAPDRCPAREMTGDRCIEHEGHNSPHRFA